MGAALGYENVLVSFQFWKPTKDPVEEKYQLGLPIGDFFF